MLCCSSAPALTLLAGLAVFLYWLPLPEVNFPMMKFLWLYHTHSQSNFSEYTLHICSIDVITTPNKWISIFRNAKSHGILGTYLCMSLYVPPLSPQRASMIRATSVLGPRLWSGLHGGSANVRRSFPIVTTESINDSCYVYQFYHNSLYKLLGLLVYVEGQYINLWNLHPCMKLLKHEICDMRYTESLNPSLTVARWMGASKM